MGATSVVVGAILWIVIAIALAIPVSILLLYKSIIIIFAKLVHPELEPLSSNDAIMTVGSSSTNPLMIIGFVIKLKNIIEIEAIKERFVNSILDPRNPDDPKRPKYSNFYSRRVLTGGYTFFKQVTKINLDDHIYESYLKDNESIEDFSSTWIMEDLPEDAPQWGLAVIHLREKQETFVLFKLDHASFDGYSLLHVVDQITDTKSPYVVTPFKESLLADIKQKIGIPCHLGELMSNENKSYFTKPSIVPKSEGLEGFMSFTTLDLVEIKTLSKKLNVSVVALLFTMVGGALRRYLLESTGSEIIPEMLTSVTLPWPNHPSKSSNAQLHNHWTLGRIRFPFNVKNQLERLQRVNSKIVYVKRVGLDKLIKLVVMPLLALFPSKIVGMIQDNSPAAPILMTNLIGGNNYKILSEKVYSIQPLGVTTCPNPYVNLFCFTFSHSDRIDISLASHNRFLPDKNALSRITNVHFRQELEEMRLSVK